MNSSELTPYKKGGIIPYTQVEVSIVVKLKNVESYLQEEMQDNPLTPDLNDQDFVLFEMDEEIWAAQILDYQGLLKRVQNLRSILCIYISLVIYIVAVD